MTTIKQDQDFLGAIIPTSLLSSAVNWIKNNLEPGDVFEDAALLEWAEGLHPSEIFSQERLIAWALDCDFVQLQD